MLVVAALVAAGCKQGRGVDDDGEGSVLRLGFSAAPAWLPWQVAQDKGLFDAVGIKVELTYFASYAESVSALNALRLDGNSQTLTDTVASVAAGSQQVVVLVNGVSAGNDKLIARAGISSVADLRGRVVGVAEGSADHLLLILGLARAGVSSTEVDIRPLAPEASVAAFWAGDLDAVALPAPFTAEALARPGSSSLLSSSDFPGAISHQLVLRRQVVERRPDDVQRLVAAWFQALRFIEENPDEAGAILAGRAGLSIEDYVRLEGGTRPLTLVDNLSAFSPGMDPSHVDGAARAISSFLVATGRIRSEPDLSTLFEAQFLKGLKTAP